MRHAGLLIRHQHARIFFSPAAARVRLDVESRPGTDLGSWDAGNSASSRDILNFTWLRLDSRGLEKDDTRSAHRPLACSEICLASSTFALRPGSTILGTAFGWNAGNSASCDISLTCLCLESRSGPEKDETYCSANRPIPACRSENSFNACSACGLRGGI